MRSGAVGSTTYEGSGGVGGWASGRGERGNESGGRRLDWSTQHPRSTGPRVSI